MTQQPKKRFQLKKEESNQFTAAPAMVRQLIQEAWSKPSGLTAAAAPAHPHLPGPNIPPAPQSNWRLIVVNLTKSFPVDTTLAAAVTAVNAQIVQDFAPIWKVSGACEVSNDEIWNDLRGSLPDGLTDHRSTEVAGEITKWAVEQRLHNGVDWSRTGIVYLTDGQIDFGGVHVDIKLNIGYDVPYALVGCEDDHWTVTFSHEVLELLADPWGHRLVHREGTNELWIVEVCDPSEATQFAYNHPGVNIKLSDFILPSYFSQGPAPKYSFRGVVHKPFAVEKGGYISFVDTREGWWKQLVWFGGDQPQVKNLYRVNEQPLRALTADHVTTGQVKINHRLLKYTEHVRNLTAVYTDLSTAFGIKYST